MIRYRPRNPRLPPEAPDPETRQQSDSRLVRIMLRLGIGLTLVALLGAAIVGTGIVAPVAGAIFVVFVAAYLLVPEVRRRVNTFWVWGEVTGLPGWTWPFGWDDHQPRRRDPDDPDRGDHLL
jgi:hypothetical protein